MRNGSTDRIVGAELGLVAKQSGAPLNDPLSALAATTPGSHLQQASYDVPHTVTPSIEETLKPNCTDTCCLALSQVKELYVLPLSKVPAWYHSIIGFPDFTNTSQHHYPILQLGKLRQRGPTMAVSPFPSPLKSPHLSEGLEEGQVEPLEVSEGLDAAPHVTMSHLGHAGVQV